MNSLEGKVAIVTGASRGIGKAIAQSLGREGAVVIGTSTSDVGAAGISETFRKAGVSGCGMTLDVTSFDACAEVVKLTAEQYGSPTILINNAGITRDNLLLKMRENEWNDVVDTNLGSIFRMSQSVLRGMMKARWGRIVNISSVVGSSGNQGQVNYAASKAGVEGFTRSMALEVGSRNITVNTVAPGFIETDMTSGLPSKQRESLLGKIPVSRLGQPEDIASAVVFLAGTAASYITGETLHVNGGIYMP